MTRRILPANTYLLRSNVKAVMAALFAAALVESPPALGQTYAILHGFGALPDGREPRGLLVEASDGMLYGTTRLGGSEGDPGKGTLFKIAKDGTGYSIIHNFAGPEGADPFAGVILGTDGVLYGTTYIGATNEGTVFAVGTDGAGFTVVKSFDGPSGSTPAAPVIEGSDGALYGTTTWGGSANLGTAFRVSKDGSGYQVLHNFLGSTDGNNPWGPVLEASDGALYGTTFGGFGSNATVFTVNKDGSGYVLLHTFSPSDGVGPYGSLLEASDGLLYGTTQGGGAGDGTLFSVARDGTGFAVVHNFHSVPTDGAAPSAGVFEGPDGALYGTTTGGGAFGTIYKINKDGTGFAILHSFLGAPSDGSAPYGAVLFGSDGALYGVASAGGGSNTGVVYRLSLN